jgi:hypothetical protein
MLEPNLQLIRRGGSIPFYSILFYSFPFYFVFVRNLSYYFIMYSSGMFYDISRSLYVEELCTQLDFYALLNS